MSPKSLINDKIKKQCFQLTIISIIIIIVKGQSGGEVRRYIKAPQWLKAKSKSFYKFNNSR